MRNKTGRAGQLAQICITLTVSTATASLPLNSTRALMLDPVAAGMATGGQPPLVMPIQMNADFTVITDPSTGIRLSLPMAIVNGPSGSSWGSNWKTPDGTLSIDTLNFGNQRTLASVFAKLRSVKGRRTAKESFEASQFALQGTDSDGTFFVVKCTDRAGEVRGISIVYSLSARSRLEAIITAVLGSLELFPAESSPSQATPQLSENSPLPLSDGGFCHLGDHSVEVRGPIVTVAVKQPPTRVRTGDAIAVEWKSTPDLELRCRTPVYIVLSTTMRTRFEGEKFLAIPPGANAPYGIKHHADRTRIFVPLHAGLGQLKGQVLVKAFEAGPFQLEWAVVEIPKLKADPQTRDDIAIGHERTTAATRLGEGISIIGGNPAIVVRDLFSTETPKRIIRSNSGEFELHVFESYYRVLDTKNGELLQERSGWDPNFSPASRFLGAYSAGPGFEIVDLYSGQVITSNDILHRERGFRGNAHLAAWSAGDGILALSVNKWGGLEVQQSLVDGSQRSFPDTSCHYCGGIHSFLLVDIDAGIVSFQGQQIGWASLLERSVGTAAATSQAWARVPRQPWEDSYSDQRSEQQQKYVQGRDTLAEQISLTMIATLGRAGFFKPDEFLTGFDSDKAPERIEDNWHIPARMRVSHVCLQGNNGKCVGRLVDWQDALTGPEDENARLAKMRVEHTESASPTSPGNSSVKLADARLINVRGVGNHGEGDPAKTNTSIDTVWSRLAQLLSDDKGDSTLNPISQGTSAKGIGGKAVDFIASITKSHPQAARFFKHSGGTDFIDSEDIKNDTFYGLRSEAKFIDPLSIREIANWRVGDRNYWLIRCFFDYGASSRSWLFLIHSSKTRATIEDFTHRLRYRVGRAPSGLDEHGKIEITEEFATTIGFGGWPSSLDTVSIAFDRYLIASGTWTIDARRWLLLYDLADNQVRFFNRDIPEAPTVAQLAVTEGGRTIVQRNSNGHIYLHDVATEKIVLHGLDIDDELVVYDPHGYFVASPEGAQFIYLKFPGLPGYNSLQQFAKTLRRPDLIQAILDGKSSSPDPALTSPPTVTMEVNVAGAEVNRSANLKLAASSAIGLKMVRVFIDGRLAREYPVTGRDASIEATIALLPESRWVTALAVDASDYESVPRGQNLTGVGKATTSRLFAIVVGTDLYDDKERIKQLSVAKADADNFGKSVMALEGAAYGNVEVASFLDATGLQSTLPAKIRETAANAGDNDTIILFAAGHGFRSALTGEFFLATRESRIDKLKETSIGWADIAAALDGAKARVIVFLDACHSGAAGNDGTNDDAVSTFLNRKASITVVAAAKGRQKSLEFKSGGAFTTALVKAITEERKATDSNSNGAIELAELYGAVKRDVVMITKGRQTPWIARNRMVGETPLF